MLVLIIACNSPKERGNVNLRPITDTLIVELKPNRLVKTKQFKDGDSLNITIAKEEYFYDNILIREIYRNYMTSEYDGRGDGEYQYFYNKEKKLIFEYYIESPSGDTVKNIYKYFKNSRDCHVLVYDYRRRLKKDMPHGDLITDEDLTEKRIWLYNTMWINTYDDKNRLIQHYIPIKDSSYTNQNRYTFRFEKDKLVEESSFLDDNKPYYSEKYEYNNDQIVMTHINFDNWPIPFYPEKQDLTKAGMH